MEGNKDEALRCIEIALQKVADGNKEACIKFLNKSIALYPTSRARDLLDFYSNDQPAGSEPTSPPPASSSSSSSSSSTTHKRHTATQNTDNASSSSATPSTGSSTTETSKPKYTKEQVELVRKIKACKNYYEVLEIKKTATDNDIKKAYRKIALLMHPDKNHAPGAEEAFKKVSQAFSCLSDPNKRSSYDLHGEENPQAQFGGMHRAGGGGGFYADDELTPEDIFNIFFGIPTRGGGRRANQYYSGFGGQPMHRAQNPNMYHFQFGGGGARRARGGQQQQQGDSSMFTVLMLVITVLYFMMSFFGAGSSSSHQSSTPLQSLYRFAPDGKYQYERIIKLGTQDTHIDLQYYVPGNLETTLRYNGIRLDQLEAEVKDVWLRRQVENCQKMDFLVGAMGATPKDTYAGRKYQADYLNAEKEGLFKYCAPLKKMGVSWS